jgi:hypothetical protein
MRRLLLCLPLCLFLAPCSPTALPPRPPEPSTDDEDFGDLSVPPARAAQAEHLAAVGGGVVWAALKGTPSDLSQREHLSVVGGVGVVAKLKPALPDAAEMERLARDNPIAFLENCIRRYKRDVKGYSLVMHKRERIDGKLQRKELIEVFFKEEPFSVYFRWLEGARKAERALYVEGENKGKMLARPNGALQRTVVGDIVERDVDGSDARQSGRYTLAEFGLKKGALRTLATWKAAKENGALHVEYLGEVKIPEAGNRVCYQLRRAPYQKPEEDGITELTMYIDKETWLMVGTVLKGKNGDLIGEYYFRDIQLNPEFKEDQFTREALKP